MFSKKHVFSIVMVFLSIISITAGSMIGMEKPKQLTAREALNQQARQESARQEELLLIDFQEKIKYYQGCYKPLYELFDRSKTKELKTKIQMHPQSQALREYLLRTACELNHSQFLKFLHHQEIININSSINPIFTLQKTQSHVIIPKLLHIACECITTNLKTIGFILKLGADIEAQNSRGATPLHIACEMGRKDVAQLLIKQKANIHAKDDCEYTPFHVACQYGHLSIVKLLYMHQADIHGTRSNRGNALCLAAFSGQSEIAQFLISQKAKILDSMEAKMTTLHHACFGGNPEIVELILRRRPDLINTQMDEGLSPLHVASAMQNAQAIKILLKHGADINIEDQKHISPIDCALMSENSEIIKLFEDHGARLLKEHEAEEAMQSLLAEVNESQSTKKKKKKKKKPKKKKAENEIQQDTIILANHESCIPATEQNIVENEEHMLEIAASDQLNEDCPPLDNTPAEGTESTESVIIEQKATPPLSSKTMLKKREITPAKKVETCEASQSTKPEYEVLLKGNLNWPRSLDKKSEKRLLEDIKALCKRSNDLDTKKLKDGSGHWRLRSGKYRIIYSVDDANQKIYIHAVELRKNAYKKINKWFKHK